MKRWYFKRRRKARYEKLSTAAPANTTPPNFWDGGNGHLLAHIGVWTQYPTKYECVWRLNGNIVQYGTSYQLPAGKTLADVTFTVTASNDNGQASVTVP